MLRVLVADDERMIRESFAAVLGLEDDIKVVAQAETGLEAIKQAKKLRPRVVVTDLKMPKQDGIEVARALNGLAKPIPTLIVTAHALPGVLQDAVLAGARGLLSKSSSASALIDAIRAVAKGETIIDPALAIESVLIGTNPLTDRERELLRLARDGATIEAISRQSGSSFATTRNHLYSAGRKLNAKNRHEAVSIALSNGWI